MTQQNPTFNVQNFELRNFTNPFLSPEQKLEVAETESRVNSQLNFLAQMLGWNGPNYWNNLPSTVDQKRQLLGGSFGVYDSYVIPRIYEIRNWDNKIVIDRLQFVEPGRQTQVVRILLGNNVYRLQSVEVEGDKYVISIGELNQEFFDLIAANEPLRADIPTYRPAPFTRSTIGISGDASFVCGNSSGTLVLYPSYDIQKKFPYKFPILLIGAYYYFDQPIYLSIQDNLEPFVTPEYDADLNLWFFQVPASLTGGVGLTPFLVWANSNSVVANNVSLEVSIQSWTDPSDWKSINVLDNFRGVWGNKGGALPFNFVFDSLSIHGTNEANSVFLPKVDSTLSFNDIVNYIYYQKTVISSLAPGNAQIGDLWWDNNTGALAVWLPDEANCGSWVEIDYRQSPRQQPAPQVVYADMSEFRSGSTSPGTIVRIDDITGLNISDNVIGVQGTITAPGVLVLYQPDNGPYWVPSEFYFSDVAPFEANAEVLPYRVPVTLTNSSSLSPQGSTYTVSNLPIVIMQEYQTLLIKYYTNTTWEIYPDSILKYIADSALVGSPLQGEMWWDFDNVDPKTRAAAIYYQSAWVSINEEAQSGPPAPVLDMGIILFFCDNFLLTEGQNFVTNDYSVKYEANPSTGKYEVTYTPFTLVGKAQFPTITISDSLTTTYRADITDLVFSGVTYYLSPNVYDAETPLRLWKAQDLQVAETLGHLAEDNFVNPLLADLNTGPGPENWEKYFVRLPLDYERNGAVWQKVALTCQNFAYYGSSIEPEVMKCPPEDDLPAIYEELFIYDGPVPDYTYVYSEPYWYSNIGFFNNVETGTYTNAGVFPASDQEFDEFNEAQLVEYDPYHNRLVDFDSAMGSGYGDWLGEYVNINPCVPLTGFFTTDLLNNGLEPIAPPVWDASIYKYPPTCENDAASYNVDANHYKIGYAYFVADASAAEDAFFDISQEAAWRYPVTQPKTLYVTPR
jgi:hypothetical protein